MRVVIFVAVIGLTAGLSEAAVVTALTGSVNTVGGSFATNNAGYIGGKPPGNPAAAILPATSSISSLNTASNPPAGLALSSATFETKDTFDGSNVNTFTWTLTTTGFVNAVRFTFTPAAPVTSGFRFADVLAPAGWLKSEASATNLLFTSTTGLKAAGAFAFALQLNLRDVLTPTQPPPTGSFTLAMAASNPEPGSLALCGLASVVAGGLGWRRRRQSKRTELIEQPAL